MALRPFDPVNRPFFAGEASGIDLSKTATDDTIAAVREGTPAMYSLLLARTYLVRRR